MADTIQTTSWGYRYTLDKGDIVEVGDSSMPEFKAHVKTIRDNVWFSLASPGGGTFAPTLNGLKVSFPFNTNIDISVYPVAPSERLPDGGIEYDISFKRRFAGNTSVTLNIDWQGITWEKIYGLDHDYDQARCADIWPNNPGPYVITPTSITDALGEVLKTRKEYEVNSYLGKATNTRHDHDENWNTGKPSYTRVSVTNLYIHRGQMTDALGNKAWVEDIQIDEVAKTITFTLPRTWMRDATYPVSQVCGVDPAYTQLMTSFQANALASDNTWDEYDTTALVGADNVVLEIILSNSTTGTEQTMGVSARASDHTPVTSARKIAIHEAEGGGQTHLRMFVQSDANGIICAYSGDVSDADYFYIVGYWSNVTFTDAWTQPGGTGSGWVASGNCPDGSQGLVAEFAFGRNAESAGIGGVRQTGSSINKSILVHEAEAGGYSLLDNLVKVDSSLKVEIYRDTTPCVYYFAGYFSSEMDFVEKWQGNTVASAGWYAWNIGSYIDEGGRIADFLCGHVNEAAALQVGVKDGDDSATNRYLTEHEAESAGSGGEFTGFGMSARANSSSQVKIYSYANPGPYSYYYLTGYFKPASTVTTYQLSVTDGLKAGDSRIESMTSSLSRTDGIKGGDTRGEGLSTLLKSISDGLKVSDTRLMSLVYYLSKIEGFKVGDARYQSSKSYPVKIDGFKLGDTKVVSLLSNLFRVDGFKVSDTRLINLLAVLTISEGLKIGDSIARSIAFYLTRGDGLKLSESDLIAMATASLIQDTLKVGESKLVTMLGALSRSDGVKFSDTTTASLAMGVIYLTLADGLKSADTPVTSLLSNLVLQDALDLGLASTIQMLSNVQKSEGIKIGDMNLPAFLIALARLDGLKISEQTSKSLQAALSLSEGLKLGDQSLRGLLISLLRADGVNIGDGRNLSASANLGLIDGIKLTDAILEILKANPVVLDGLKISDLTLQIIASDIIYYECLVNEGFQLGESPTMQRIILLTILDELYLHGGAGLSYSFPTGNRLNLRHLVEEAKRLRDERNLRFNYPEERSRNPPEESSR